MEISHEMHEKLEVMGKGEQEIEALRLAFSQLKEPLEEALEKVLNFLLKFWKLAKKVAVKWYQLEEEKKIVVRQRHKRDFSRRKMEHQVIDRKPHMIRKIIH